MSTSGTDIKGAQALHVSVSDDALVVDLADGRTFTDPLAWFPCLSQGSVELKRGSFRTPGLPARVEAKPPSAGIAAAVAGVTNHLGHGPFTVFPLSHHDEPLMPGDRTRNGGAYTFQAPGPLSVQ
jgi:hypothetical protein